MKIKFIFWCLIIIGAHPLTAQVEVRSVGIESRENGTVMTIRLNESLPEDNISGWKTTNGWFYVTLFNAVADSERLATTAYTYPIRDFQTITLEESSQIGIKLAKEVDQHEFYLSANPPEILVSLRYPIESVPILAEKRATHKAQILPSDADIPPPEPNVAFTSNRAKTIGYFLGTALTVSGIIQQKSIKDKPTKELKAGLLLLLLTTLLDQDV